LAEHLAGLSIANDLLALPVPADFLAQCTATGPPSAFPVDSHWVEV